MGNKDEFEAKLLKGANKAKMFVNMICVLINLAFISLVAWEGMIFHYIWDRFFTNDVLYLCSWFFILGIPIAYLFIDAGISISSIVKENLDYNIKMNTRYFRYRYYKEKGE